MNIVILYDTISFSESFLDVLAFSEYAINI